MIESSASREPMLAPQDGVRASGSSLDEAGLIQSTQKGDLTAFNQLVLAYQDDLYRWVLYLVHDEPLAEDLTQLTFITAYQKLHTYRGGSFRSWLFQIARNLSYDEFRRLKRHPTVSLNQPTGDEDDREFEEWIQAAEGSPEDALERNEQAGWVHQVLDQLPDEYRQILILVDMVGMGYKEAAQVLGIPVGTVKSRVARGRVGFRKLVYDTAFQQPGW